jgi:hypothetical protein
MSLPTTIQPPIRLKRKRRHAIAAVALAGGITATVLAITLSGGSENAQTSHQTPGNAPTLATNIPTRAGEPSSVDAKQSALLQRAMLAGFPGLAGGPYPSTRPTQHQLLQTAMLAGFPGLAGGPYPSIRPTQHELLQRAMLAGFPGLDRR